MPGVFFSQFIAFSTFCLLGGWLAFISYSNPVQAKIISDKALVEPLPLSLSRGTLYSQQSLPHLKPSSALPVIEFQKSKPPRVTPDYQYNHHYEQKPPSYLVYVDGDSLELLQQVRLIEPRAYIRQFNGRPVIQAGVFTREYNAQQRLAQLHFYGIDHTQIVSGDTEERQNYFYTEEHPDYSDTEENPYYTDRYHEYKTRSKSYYVVIPTNFEDLPLVESRVRQSVGLNAGVKAKKHPLGLHIAVGPFAEQLEAEHWNDYLQHLGFSSARVYYGG
jgi:hypothetical protein